jgi:hypothetical protein
MTRDVLSAPLLVLASQGERTTILLELVDAAPFPAFGAQRDVLRGEVHTLTQAAFHAHAVKFDARGALAALRRAAALLAEEVHAWIRATRLRVRALPPDTLPTSELAAWPDLPRLRPYLAATIPRLDAALAALEQPLTATLLRVLAPDLSATGAALRARAVALLDELNQATAASVVASRDAEAARERLEVWYRQFRRMWTAILAHDPNVLPKLDLEACQQAAAVVRPRVRRPVSGDPPPNTHPAPAARETCRPVDDPAHVSGADPRARCGEFDAAAARREGEWFAGAGECMTLEVERDRSPADSPTGGHGVAASRVANHRSVPTRSTTRRGDGAPPSSAGRRDLRAASRTAAVDGQATSHADPVDGKSAPGAARVDGPSTSRVALGADPDTPGAPAARRPPSELGATHAPDPAPAAQAGARGAPNAPPTPPRPTAPSSPTETS